MRIPVAITLLVLTATACKATRAPEDEDGINAGRVNPAWRTDGTSVANDHLPARESWHAPDPYEK